jgi:hypothetical protein
MSDPVNSVLLGAVAMASLLASLFFLRFWRQTQDIFFALFALAFGVDAVGRFSLGLNPAWEEHAPIFYLLRLLTFSLIIFAIVIKNRPQSWK